MATKKKMLQAAAGNAGGAALDITDVFSTYLYAGTSAAQTITNGIDLAGEGGMVWGKMRSGPSTGYPWIFDTERGPTKWLYPNEALAEQSAAANGITSFNLDGFDLQGTSAFFNGGTSNYASWTWRKAPKFFDCVTYTGTGNSAADFQDISHNLGTAPGTVIIKRLNSAENWAVWHRSIPSDMLQLNVSDSSGDAGGRFTASGVANMTSTTFRVYGDNQTGTSGGTYVAYLFAHNNGDGEFGPDSDQDIIKCGSYTGNGSGDGPVIDLGFEPQWVMIKNATGSGPWVMLDSMRGWPVTDSNTFTDRMLWANTNNAEYTTVKRANITSTGFQIKTSNSQVNTSNNNYIYMAIRRGPLAQPESGTEVFAQDFVFSSEANAAGVQYYSGFPVDMSLFSGSRSVGGNHDVRSRLTGDKRMFSNATDAETSAGTPWWDTNEGWKPSTGGTLSTDAVTWMWKRAPGYFDVVAYSGNGVRGNTVSHNLGVAPEMIWVKSRDQADYWVVYHSAIGNETKLILDNTGGPSGSDFAWWAKTDPTASVFSVGESGRVNGSGENYIAYLFATLPGVSKVGSFTGNGTSQDINCGFTSAARFVLLKRTDSSGTWFILDSERGIVAGNDAILRPNTTTAEDNNYDIIDPLSSGFTINYVSAYNMNASGATYIFYAIA